MKKLLFLLILVFTFQSSFSQTQQIKIGALLSLTGEWSSLGITSKTALEIASKEINEYYKSAGINKEIMFEIEDTKLNPETALEKLKILSSKGIKIVIGPQSSAEVSSVKNFADENGILILSMGSTASSLSIAGDNIFRLCPDDYQEARAITALMQDDGIKAIVPIYREDLGNENLFQSVRKTFESDNGTVSEAITYSSATKDFSTTIKKLKSTIKNLNQKYPSKSIGIFLAGFDENRDLLGQIKPSDELNVYKWYGSDGAALSSVILNDNTASEFAQKVTYPCPIFGLDSKASEKWLPLQSAIKNKSGINADAFTMCAYDGAWICAMASLICGDTKDIAVIKTCISKISESYYGATGWCILNSAGDRKYGSFDYWIVKKDIDGKYGWSKLEVFDAVTGKIVGN
ncbi:MAG: penicillin-binding protein activator [Ignavibacteria bacterium]|nr:penicillin-binding protein activator [Ignavibacteria bacterium]